MASLIWNDSAIVEAMIKFRKTNGKWPKSRDWWYANPNRWPSFTTVCKLRPHAWKGLLKLAREQYGQATETEINY